MCPGWTHHTHWAGITEIRDAIASKLSCDPNSEIVVTRRSQEAMNVIFQGLLEPGDRALIGNPLYTSYKNVVQLAGSKMTFVPTANT